VVRRVRHEEAFRAALDSPKKVEAGETLSGVTAPTSGMHRAPVLEMADKRGLQPRDHFGRPGPSPGWGTILFPNQNPCDTTL
jgi:hypothetical protein